MSDHEDGELRPLQDSTQQAAIYAEVDRLWDAQPRLIRRSSSRSPEFARSPVQIGLVAHAVATAAELHAKYGDAVELTMGMHRYPPSTPAQVRAPGHQQREQQRLAALPEPVDLDPAELRVELDGPLTVPSAHKVNHALLITNLGDTAITLHTNGKITAMVADPATGLRVGRFGGLQTMPRVRRQVDPGETVRIPLLVGTDSVDPSLGYAVPPGQWAIYAILALADGRRIKTPLLEVTIT
jgi:hypothetical protein